MYSLTIFAKDFDDRSWAQAEVLTSPPTGQLNVSMIPPIRTVETFAPKAIHQPEPGKFVFDFGQNMVCLERVLSVCMIYWKDTVIA